MTLADVAGAVHSDVNRPTAGGRQPALVNARRATLRLGGVNELSLHSITQDRNSDGPPFKYGGGDTGLNTVGSRSLRERQFRTCPSS